MALKLFVAICVLLKCINAIPVPGCKQRLAWNEIGLCNPNGTVDIWHCQSCPPGYGLSVECGRMEKAGTVVDCVLCERNHTYSDKYDVGQCIKCTKCQKNEVIKSGQCELDKDTIQCTCSEGYYRDTTSRDCKPCSWCCSDKSNPMERECNIPQVPLGKWCSWQTTQSCAPTTPAPTPVPTSAVTSTTEKSSTYLTPTITTLTTSKSTLTVTDSPNDTKKPSGSKEKESISWKQIIIGIAVSFLIFILILVFRCYLLGRKATRNQLTSQNRTRDSDREPLHHGSSTEVNSNEPGEHVALDPDKATATYHAEPEQGNIGVRPLQANGTVPLPTTRLDKEELCFICQTLGTNISDLKYDVMHTLCKMLNVSVDNKDYKNLAAFRDLDYYARMGLQKKEDPMKDVIDVMVSQSKSLESFLEELYTISRGDVVQELYEIAKEKT